MIEYVPHSKYRFQQTVESKSLIYKPLNVIKMGQRIVNILEMENDLCFQFENYRRESGPSPWAELIKLFMESLS